MSVRGVDDPRSVRYAVSRDAVVMMTSEEWRRAQGGEVVVLDPVVRGAAEWVSLFQASLIACKGSEPLADGSQHAAIAVTTLRGRDDATEVQVAAELGPIVAGALGTRYEASALRRDPRTAGARYERPSETDRRQSIRMMLSLLLLIVIDFVGLVWSPSRAFAFFWGAGAGAAGMLLVILWLGYRRTGRAWRK